VTDFDVVTGAFSYSGAAIARELLAAGRRVRTLTGHPGRAPAGTPIEAKPLDFGDPAGLERSLRGAGTLYNTYWVRFAHGRVDHPAAVAHSRVLFRAAAQAGVRRIVHVSITNPSPDSPYPYFRGKAAVEQALTDLRVPHAVLRPAILFGGDGVLINNIAWLLRRLPVFAVGGTGEYRVRPIHVDDLARLAVRTAGSGRDEVIDAVGPDRPAFGELVGSIKDAVGSRSLVVHVPGAMIRPAARVLGLALRGTLLTAEEYQAMADGLADTEGPATGGTSLIRWITEHSGDLGRGYANELTRHFR
jgi:NADH dehydrogenase